MLKTPYKKKRKVTTSQMKTILKRMTAKPTESDYANLAFNFFEFPFTVLCDKTEENYFTDNSGNLLVFTSAKEAYRYAKLNIYSPSSKTVDGAAILTGPLNNVNVPGCVIDPSSKLNLFVKTQFLNDLFDYYTSILKTKIELHPLPESYNDLVWRIVESTFLKFGINQSEVSLFLTHSSGSQRSELAELQLLVLIKRQPSKLKRQKLQHEVYQLIQSELNTEDLNVWYLEDKKYLKPLL